MTGYEDQTAINVLVVIRNPHIVPAVVSAIKARIKPLIETRIEIPVIPVVVRIVVDGLRNGERRHDTLIGPRLLPAQVLAVLDCGVEVGVGRVLDDPGAGDPGREPLRIWSFLSPRLMQAARHHVSKWL